jgi:hypothetical protein
MGPHYQNLACGSQLARENKTPGFIFFVRHQKTDAIELLHHSKSGGLAGYLIAHGATGLGKGHLDGWKTAGGHRRNCRQLSVAKVTRERAQVAPLAPKPEALPLLIIADDLSLLQLYRHHMARWPFEGHGLHDAQRLRRLGHGRRNAPRLLVCD